MQRTTLLAGKFNHLQQCRHGWMLFNVNDEFIGRSLQLYGEYSEGETEVFRQFVQEGHVVLDVGANLGAHTLYFANTVGRRGAVLAFEPQRVIFQTLCANMALNSLTNVYCNNVAVGAEHGSVLVPPLDAYCTQNFGSLSLLEAAEGVRVEKITLDSLNLPRCNFLKIDVEGMELDVLRGARQTIERHKPVLYVENDRADHSAELTRFIDSLGYAMYRHQPRYFNPQNWYQNSENVFGTTVSLNLLCIDHSRKVQIEGLPRVGPGETQTLV
jgi:FkbM family methyltransferase